MSVCLSLALLACLGIDASPATRESQVVPNSPRAIASDVVVCASREVLVASTRAYVLQEIEGDLRNMLHRWAQLERRLAHRHDSAQPQFAADRLKLAGTLRSAERERASRRNELRHLVGKTFRLPRRLRSPEVVASPRWLWDSRVDREHALRQAYAAASRAAGINAPAVSVGGEELALQPDPTTLDADIFARIDTLIHAEIPDAPLGADLAGELQVQLAVAYFHAGRRASYRDVLLPEAEALRKDATAAWERGELETTQMLAVEWERLSVELGSLEALLAYEAALVRVQAIIDRP